MKRKVLIEKEKLRLVGRLSLWILGREQNLHK